ncbi:MAG: hypothetical protein KC933_23925 [Myxococcales bacterium]|nr:hypothetical protein [Myxococcales bacterium]
MSDGKHRNTNKPEDWTEMAERLGNQLARGLDAFGDRVQQALEALDNPQARRRHGMKVEDHRDNPEGVAVEGLLRGDCFEHQGDLFMRLGSIPDTKRRDEVDAVNLANGDVRLFARGTRVTAVDAKVVVESRRSST